MDREMQGLKQENDRLREQVREMGERLSRVCDESEAAFAAQVEAEAEVKRLVGGIEKAPRRRVSTAAYDGGYFMVADGDLQALLDSGPAVAEGEQDEAQGLREDLSVARQSLYEVAEQRNNLEADLAAANERIGELEKMIPEGGREIDGDVIYPRKGRDWRLPECVNQHVQSCTTCPYHECHDNCTDKYHPVLLMRRLVEAMEVWANDEDGIHPDAWPVYRDVMRAYSHNPQPSQPAEPEQRHLCPECKDDACDGLSNGVFTCQMFQPADAQEGGALREGSLDRAAAMIGEVELVDVVDELLFYLAAQDKRIERLGQIRRTPQFGQAELERRLTEAEERLCGVEDGVEVLGERGDKVKAWCNHHIEQHSAPVAVRPVEFNHSDTKIGSEAGPVLCSDCANDCDGSGNSSSNDEYFGGAVPCCDFIPKPSGDPERPLGGER